MKKVYIAGPLSAPATEYIKNVHKMLQFSERIRKMGYAVYVPCLDFLQGMMFGDYEFGDYYNNSLEFLKVCDMVYVCPGWENSKGTRSEVLTAKSLGIPIVYSIAEL